MNRTLKTTLTVTASAVTLLVVAVIAGVAYTWYEGEYGEEVTFPTSQQPVVGTGGIKDSNRPKISDTATIGAVVQNISSPVVPGSNASIMVRTNPGATCVISVMYNGVPAKDSGLVDKKADQDGLAEWTWTVPSSTPLGKWPVKVTCANKKNSAVVQNDLVVVRTLE